MTNSKASTRVVLAKRTSVGNQFFTVKFDNSVITSLTVRQILTDYKVFAKENFA